MRSIGLAATSSHNMPSGRRPRHFQKKRRSGHQTSSTTRCGYCGRKIVVQDRQGEKADGNLMVLELDGSQKRVCRSGADGLSVFSDHIPQSQALARSAF